MDEYRDAPPFLRRFRLPLLASALAPPLVFLVFHATYRDGLALFFLGWNGGLYLFALFHELWLAKMRPSREQKNVLLRGFLGGNQTIAWIQAIILPVFAAVMTQAVWPAGPAGVVAAGLQWAYTAGLAWHAWLLIRTRRHQARNPGT